MAQIMVKLPWRQHTSQPKTHQVDPSPGAILVGRAQREACATPGVSFLQEEPKELFQNVQRPQKGKADLVPGALQARPLQGSSSEPLGKDDLI